MVTGVKTFFASVLSLGFGLALWYGFYFLLGHAIGETLTSQEETAFKVGYIGTSVVSVALSLLLGYLLARFAGLSPEWILLLTLFLMGVVAFPLLATTSFANDCNWALEWPLKVDGCD